MSSKRTSDMKEAFKKLQVQSPYKLPKDGPGFTPPTVSPRKEVFHDGEPADEAIQSAFCSPKVASTPGANHLGSFLPLVENTEGRSNGRCALPEVDPTSGRNDPAFGLPVVEETTGVVDHGSKLPEVSPTGGKIDHGLTPPLVENTSGSGNPTLSPPEVVATRRQSHPRVENTLGSAQENPLHAFLPPGRTQVNWREKGAGKLHIPHQLFEFAQKATSSRNELLIFNCLIRFSLGFHRTSCEAGYSFIAQWTGIDDSANVRKSMKTLLAAGLIVKIREADSVRNIAAVYEVPVVRFFLASENEEGTSTPGSGGNTKGHSQPLVESTTSKSNHPPPGRINPAPVVISTTKKEIKNKTLKKAADPIFLVPDQIEEQAKRKLVVEEAIRKFDSAMTSEAQSDYLAQYEKTEFAHGFLPPRNVMRNMAALHWVNNGMYEERRATC